MCAEQRVEIPRNRRSFIRDRLVDAPGSVGAGTRARRWQVLQRLFPDMTDMSVVDLGGTVESWRRAPVRPANVTVVNLTEPGEWDEPWLVPVLGDACAARSVLTAAALPTSYDLTFSNSLIEHVGGHAKRVELAREVKSLSTYHWVQTPYRYFPIEPHWLFPFMQHLPVRAKAIVADRWPLTNVRPSSRKEATSEVMWTELISITEMAAYFPDSRIVRERLAGLTKSISAVIAPGAEF